MDVGWSALPNIHHRAYPCSLHRHPSDIEDGAARAGTALIASFSGPPGEALRRPLEAVATAPRPLPSHVCVAGKGIGSGMEEGPGRPRPASRQRHVSATTRNAARTSLGLAGRMACGRWRRNR